MLVFVSRPRRPPPSEVSRRLQNAARRRAQAERELRAAVVAALAADGSVREVARLAQLSTNTVQSWALGEKGAGGE